jgi:hypothetical protein
MKVVRLSVIALALLVIVSCAGKSPNPSQPNTPTLVSFTSATWNLKVDRAWDGQTGAPQFPSDTIADSAYKAVSGGPVYQVVASAGGQQVTIAGTVQARRVKATDTVVQYDVYQAAFAGGRFVVWSSSEGLQAEFTIYGSGVPITSSERGLLVPAQ